MDGKRGGNMGEFLIGVMLGITAGMLLMYTIESENETENNDEDEWWKE